MNRQLLFLLFKPSLLSGIAVVIAAAGLLGMANWAFITSDPFLYDFFFGQGGVVTALESAPEPALDANASPLLYYLVVSGVAIGVGMGLFWSLRAIHRQVSIRSGRPLPTKLERYRRQVLNQELKSRILFRLAVLAGWTLYAALFVQFLMPFAVLLSRIGAEQLGTADGWIKNAVAFALAAAGLHVHVILARLLAMRPRLFGGEAAIEEALY